MSNFFYDVLYFKFLISKHQRHTEEIFCVSSYFRQKHLFYLCIIYLNKIKALYRWFFSFIYTDILATNCAVGAHTKKAHLYKKYMYFVHKAVLTNSGLVIAGVLLTCLNKHNFNKRITDTIEGFFIFVFWYGSKFIIEMFFTCLF